MDANGKRLTEGQMLAAVLLYYGFIDHVRCRTEKLLCPFHADRNPSMKVDFNLGEFYCFGCGARGNAKDFVKHYEKQVRNLDDLECEVKYERIIRGTGKHEVPKFIASAPEVSKHINRSLYDEAYMYYHGLKTVDWESPESLDEMKMLDYMEHRGFTAKTLSLCKAKVACREPYLLIFPLIDNGKFKGWVSRTSDPEAASYRKYLYNTGFRKALCLVGDYGNFGNELDYYVVVVEGYLDRLKFIQFGVKNVVALLGWKMSEVQEQKLRKCGIMNIISSLDNDECGRKGTAWLRERKFNVIRFCYLKGVKDPGDMTSESFKKMWSKTMKRYQESISRA